MTIALGILADDGVVIAADSQESGGYPGSVKTDGMKILSGVVHASDGAAKRSLGISGSGSAGFLDAIHQDLHEAFDHQPDLSKFKKTARKIVRDFYHQHILPLHVLGANQPITDLVVGLSWAGKRPLLLATQHSTIRECRDFVAVGAGWEHATMLLRRILPHAGNLSFQRAAYLAAYVVFHVKQFVDGCGGPTHIHMLHDGYVEEFTSEQLAHLEQRFNDYLDFDALAVNYLCGRAVMNEEEALAILAKYLKSARQHTLEMGERESAGGWNLNWAWEEDRPRILRHSSPVSFEP
jgi:hypothetical protein